MNKKKKRMEKFFSVFLVFLLVLMILGFCAPIASVTHERADKLRARNAMAALVAAVDGYYSDYGRLPFNSSELPQVDSLVRTDEPVMAVLVGIDVEGMNRKQNVYFTATAAKGSERQNAYDGIWEDSVSAVLFDPWKKGRGQERGYILLLDYDGDGKLEDPFRPGRILERRVLAWSTGKDGKWERANPKEGVNRDNVYSWFK